MKPADREMRCPTCGKPMKEKGAYFPFCCRRCRMIDLGRWLQEDYRIAGDPILADDDAD